MFEFDALLGGMESVPYRPYDFPYRPIYRPGVIDRGPLRPPFVLVGAHGGGA